MCSDGSITTVFKCAHGARAVQAEVEAQRKRIQDIVTAMPVECVDDDCRFVASTWLADWANAAPPEAPLDDLETRRKKTPIDNSDLQCPHGALDPGAWSQAKRVSLQSWQALRERCGGGPEFGPMDLCVECCQQQLRAIVERCALALVYLYL